MSPSYVTIDASPDLDATPTLKSGSKRSLLLAPPSVAAHEEKLRDLFAAFGRSATDLQMLDRLSAGLVTLSPSTYGLVLVLTDDDGARRAEALKLLTREVYAKLVPSMTTGARLRFQDGPLGVSEAREAILAGLVPKDGSFEKPEAEDTTVPLRLGAKKKESVQAKTLSDDDDLGEYEDGDELIDEDDLLSEEERKRAPQQPPAGCEPELARKKRRPCKDCTCGLAERLEAEDQARQAAADETLNVLKLKSDDLALDFTVRGKTGSCNSCSLGDAYRCSSCPYIGLPPFEPGQEVKILNGLVQL